MNQLSSDYVLICLPAEVVTVESEVVMVTVVVAAEPLVVVGVCVTFKRIIDSCAYVSVLPLIDENCFSIYFLKVNLNKPLHEFSLNSLSSLSLPSPPVVVCCYLHILWSLPSYGGVVGLLLAGFLRLLLRFLLPLRQLFLPLFLQIIY